MKSKYSSYLEPPKKKSWAGALFNTFVTAPILICLSLACAGGVNSASAPMFLSWSIALFFISLISLVIGIATSVLRRTRCFIMWSYVLFCTVFIIGGVLGFFDDFNPMVNISTPPRTQTEEQLLQVEELFMSDFGLLLSANTYPMTPVVIGAYDGNNRPSERVAREMLNDMLGFEYVGEVFYDLGVGIEGHDDVVVALIPIRFSRDQVVGRQCWWIKLDGTQGRGIIFAEI